MTTFTLQDLTPQQKTQVAKHEEMHKMFQSMYPSTPKEAEALEDMLDAIPPQHAPTPQPTLCEVTQTPDLESIINTICAQLQLLSTVINQQPNTTPPEGNSNTTLQETVALTLQQADWFKDLVRETIVDEVSLEDVVKDIVKEEVSGSVESEVEHYFDYNFSVTDHFDFDDAVSDAVDDRLDDLVKEKIDECIEEVVAEKLSSANVSISF